jgi:hypothetical protein
MKYNPLNFIRNRRLRKEWEKRVCGNLGIAVSAAKEVDEKIKAGELKGSITFSCLKGSCGYFDFLSRGPEYFIKHSNLEAKRSAELFYSIRTWIRRVWVKKTPEWIFRNIPIIPPWRISQKNYYGEPIERRCVRSGRLQHRFALKDKSWKSGPLQAGDYHKIPNKPLNYDKYSTTYIHLSNQDHE